jgi:hypothetical protein
LALLKSAPLLYHQREDDLAVIAGKLTYIPQQNGNSFGTATPLTIKSTNGASFNAAGSGIISQTNQLDYFSLDVTTPGNLSMTVTVVAYSNLPVEATVYHSEGTQIGWPINNIEAAGVENGRGFSGVVKRLPEAARYYMTIKGVGYINASDYWSSYGSLGQYSIAVSFTSIPR